MEYKGKYIMSITKFNGKYYIYFPNIKDKPIWDKLCRWWGDWDTFEDCFKVLKEKDEEYNHLIIDKKLLRKNKLKKINEKIKKI